MKVHPAMLLKTSRCFRHSATVRELCVARGMSGEGFNELLCGINADADSRCKSRHGHFASRSSITDQQDSSTKMKVHPAMLLKTQKRELARRSEWPALQPLNSACRSQRSGATQATSPAKVICGRRQGRREAISTPSLSKLRSGCSRDGASPLAVGKSWA